MSTSALNNNCPFYPLAEAADPDAGGAETAQPTAESPE